MSLLLAVGSVSLLLEPPAHAFVGPARVLPRGGASLVMATDGGELAQQLSAAAARGAVAPLDGFPALCGPVATGFGRGSKKLGVPTANLPCSLFQEALADLSCGPCSPTWPIQSTVTLLARARANCAPPSSCRCLHRVGSRARRCTQVRR